MQVRIFGLLVLTLAGCGSEARQARFTVGPCGEAAGFAPGEWRLEEAPVLERGASGAWDSVDVLNPSVVAWSGRYLNLYSGFDGERWHTGAAWSEDGIEWRKSARSPVLSPRGGTWEGDYIAANGAVVAVGERLLYWFQAGARNSTALGLVQSNDGERWKRVADEPVFGPGARGQWDEAGVGDPYVVVCGEAFYLYYLGQDRFGVQRLGLARSNDGVHWQRSHLNPLLEPGGRGEFDERGLGEPAVVWTAEGWKMLYTGRDSEEKRRMRWAESKDGVNWEKSGPVHAGEAAWNDAVVCDATFLSEDGRLRVWYGGGSRPSPDENLDGAIGAVRMGYSGSM